MRFVDTNIILRYVTRDDEAKAQACMTLLQRLETGEETAISNDTVVGEVVFVLESPRQYGLSRTAIRSLLIPVVHLRGLRLPNKRLYDEAFDLYCNYPIDFVDAFNAAYMRNNNVSEIYSYDKDFDKLEGIARIEPAV
ncbi:MAG: PIN domain-containing protein [Chloroflexi bacterium]|nr:PIN domain-containing protein [Chloroflexota bacterium]